MAFCSEHEKTSLCWGDSDPGQEQQLLLENLELPSGVYLWMVLGAVRFVRVAAAGNCYSHLQCTERFSTSCSLLNTLKIPARVTVPPLNALMLQMGLIYKCFYLHLLVSHLRWGVKGFFWMLLRMVLVPLECSVINALIYNISTWKWEVIPRIFSGLPL